MKEFKTPDLNAPRFRPRSIEIANARFFKEFRAAYPEYAHISNKELKAKLSMMNGSIWKTVIQERDGVELSNGLGCIFIGTCPKKKSDNIDYYLSIKYGKKIQHRNYESDNYTAKIFYTNFSSKYRFKNHQLWGFDAVREFKRAVPPEYRKHWTRYVKVDNMQKVSQLFRRQSYKLEQKRIERELMHDYNEFDL